MFNRGARKELRKKGGIADVQYFQNAGRVDVSNISNQDAINMALNASPSLRTRLNTINTYQIPLVPGMYINKEGGIFQPNSSITKITNEQINQLLRNRAERAKSPIGLEQGLSSVFKPEEAVTAAGLLGSKVGQYLAEGVDYAKKGITSVAELFQKKNLDVPGLRKLIEEGDPKGILDGIDLTQLEGIEKIDPSLARPPGMVPGKITQVGDENQITKSIPELKTMYDTDNVPEIDASINEEIRKLLYPDEKEVQEQKKEKEEKKKIITEAGEKNELDRGARDPVDTSKEETSKEETSDVEPPVSRPPELVKEVFKTGNEEQKKNVIDDIIKQFTDRAPKYEGLNQGLAIAKIGFAMAAGESPNAMTNIAKALSDGADMLIKDKQKKDAFNRQISLTGLQLGLTEQFKINAEERLSKAKEKELRDKPLVMIASKDIEYKGKKYTKNSAVPISQGELMDGNIPDGLQPTSFASSVMQGIADSVKLNKKYIQDLIKSKQIKDIGQARKVREEYDGAARSVIQAENGIGLLNKAMLLTAEGGVTGLSNVVKDAMVKGGNLFGIEIGKEYKTKAEAVSAMKQALQDLIPVTLGGVQSANSISNRDVEFLITAFFGAGALDGGIFNLATEDTGIMVGRLQNAIKKMRSEQQRSIGVMRSIEGDLVNLYRPGTTESALGIINPIKEKVAPYFSENLQTVKSFDDLYEQSETNEFGLPVFKLKT
tara:strand:- start:3111 stop:5258 length:2148 start_codon:yes stop_codon:yes gene_type:complete